MSEPLVSILIPAHNAALWLADTLRSALAQTWPRKEIVVVENGSTDATYQIAQSFLDRGVKVLSMPVANAAAARNHAFAVSSGDFIQYLDADDLISPRKIEVQLGQLNDGEPSLSISARSEFFDGEDPRSAAVQREWPCVPSQDPTTWLSELLGAGGSGGFVALHQWVSPRSLVQQAGPWNENLTVNDDGEFFARVVLLARDIRTAPDQVAYYRRHRTARNLSAAFRRDRRHIASLLHATDLIAEHLLGVRDEPQIHRAFARHYYECAIAAFPLHPAISRIAEKKALSHNPQALPPPPTSRSAAFVRRLTCWRGERLLASIATFHRKCP